MAQQGRRERAMALLREVLDEERAAVVAAVFMPAPDGAIERSPRRDPLADGMSLETGSATDAGPGVHGVSDLRVADASIMPAIVAATPTRTQHHDR